MLPRGSVPLVEESGQRLASRLAGWRVPPELVAALALALLGSVAFPFAPASLPMHWGFGESFDDFASSWVVLLAVPWSCALGAVVLTSLPRYRERPRIRLSAQLLAGTSLVCLLLALLYVAAGSPPLTGPE
jgi:hypothetical protein